MVPCTWTFVPNRRSPPAILLREAYREDGRIVKRTVANLSDWPMDKVEALRAVLKSQGRVRVVAEDDVPLDVVRSLPYGHVVAVAGMMRRLTMEQVIGLDGEMGKRVLALIAARILDPASKLAMAQELDGAGGWTHAVLGEVGLGESIDEDDLYEAMDALLPQQEHIERTLASRHLQDGSLVLYDLTSTYFTGTHCPLAKLDGQRGHLGMLNEQHGPEQAHVLPVRVEPGFEIGDRQRAQGFGVMLLQPVLGPGAHELGLRPRRQQQQVRRGGRREPHRRIPAAASRIPLLGNRSTLPGGSRRPWSVDSVPAVRAHKP
jgi:hypothetical protein